MRLDSRITPVTPEEIDAAYAHALTCGARAVKAPQSMFGDGCSRYFADPDSHLWEMTHNPFMPLGDDGHMVLPQ